MRKFCFLFFCFDFNLVEFKLKARRRIYYSFCMLGALEGIFLREGMREKNTELDREKKVNPGVV